MWAAMRKQAGSIAGLFFMIFLSILCVLMAITLYTSGTRSVSEEMERLGFGNFTAWVSGIKDETVSEIEGLPDVDRVGVQPLIFAGYEIKGRYSDNDGQLIVYDGKVPYHFISEDGTAVPEPEIEEGTVYISPALKSSFDIEIGDTIQFELSRSGGIRSLEVAGYFEDAFMGSSMIDMKSFLICEADRQKLLQVITESPEGDALGKDGAMLHIFKSAVSRLSDLEFHEMIQENTELSLYTDFTYSRDSILNYMLLLQDILCGFLFAFSGVLFLVCLIVSGKSLSDAMEQDRKDLAVLKTVGVTGGSIRKIYFGLYGGAVLAGMMLGLIPVMPMAHMAARFMTASTGMRIDIQFPAVVFFVIFAAYITVFAVFLYRKTGNILRIAPIQAIREASNEKPVCTRIRKRFLSVGIAVRELTAHKKKYISVCLISVLLVLFLSVIGRMGAWLGADGEGLMNAFSVADHDLGVQPFNDTVPMDEIERVINWYSPVKETYELAMESVTVNGYETTANVLNDTDYFHVLEGKVCDGNGVLITQTIANELGLAIGDTVQIAGGGRMDSYTVSGIYQCANGMGNNVGLSMAGYSKIGSINGFIWCYHYILEDGSVRDYAMEYLQDSYQGIDVHTNSWSGLDGIVSLMHGLMIVIYLVAALCILVSASLSTHKLILAETGNMAVYKSMGMSDNRLRLSFSVRFLIVVVLGALIGVFLSVIFADSLIGKIFQMFGIGEFQSRLSVLGTFLPPLAVTLLFFGFVWLFSARLKRVSIIKLISEEQ